MTEFLPVSCHLTLTILSRISLSFRVERPPSRLAHCYHNIHDKVATLIRRCLWAVK